MWLPISLTCPLSRVLSIGVVTLHTIHHLTEAEHIRAFDELYRVLAPGSAAAGGKRLDHSTLMALASLSCAWAIRCAICSTVWLER